MKGKRMEPDGCILCVSQDSLCCGTNPQTSVPEEQVYFSLTLSIHHRWAEGSSPHGPFSGVQAKSQHQVLMVETGKLQQLSHWPPQSSLWNRSRSFHAAIAGTAAWPTQPRGA